CHRHNPGRAPWMQYARGQAPRQGGPSPGGSTWSGASVLPWPRLRRSASQPTRATTTKASAASTSKEPITGQPDDQARPQRGHEQEAQQAATARRGARGVLAHGRRSSTGTAAPLEQVATGDLIVVGKVTGFGPKMVKSELFKGDMRQMQIAIVKVGDTVLGKGGKEIKVGFFPPASGPVGRPIRPGFRRGGLQLKVDQEGVFFLM